MSSKFIAIICILCGTIGVFLAYKAFKICSLRAVYAGKRFIDLAGILCIFLYAIPLVYLAFTEENLISFSLSKGSFLLLAGVCYLIATVINVSCWGIPYGFCFSVCHILLAGTIYLMVYTAIFAVFLLFALFAPTGRRVGGFWIGRTLIGDEFLVLPIGDGLYQDGDLNTYQKVNNDTMLGSDGKLYYIHRKA